MASLGARGSELCFALSPSWQSLPGGKRTRSIRNTENQTPPLQTAVRSEVEGMARARQRREGRRAGERNGVWTPRRKPRARANAPGDGAGLGAGTGQVSGVERAERRLRLRGRQGSAVLQGQLPPSFSSKLLLLPLL